MKIPMDLKTAINSYYAYQRSGWLWSIDKDKYKKPPEGWKDRCLDVIERIAAKHKMRFSSCAGRLWFQRGKQTFETDDPLPIWESKS